MNCSLWKGTCVHSHSHTRTSPFVRRPPQHIHIHTRTHARAHKQTRTRIQAMGTLRTLSGSCGSASTPLGCSKVWTCTRGRLGSMWPLRAQRGRAHSRPSTRLPASLRSSSTWSASMCTTIFFTLFPTRTHARTYTCTHAHPRARANIITHTPTHCFYTPPHLHHRANSSSLIHVHARHVWVPFSPSLRMRNSSGIRPFPNLTPPPRQHTHPHSSQPHLVQSIALCMQRLGQGPADQTGCGGNVEEERKYDVASMPISIHTPLNRLLACMCNTSLLFPSVRLLYSEDVC